MLDAIITIIGIALLVATLYGCLLLLARRRGRLANPTQIAQAEAQMGPYHHERMERASKADGRWVKK